MHYGQFVKLLLRYFTFSVIQVNLVSPNLRDLHNSVGGVNMETPTNLSLEQQFKLQLLREQVKTLNLEQAQDYLMELLRQSMIKDVRFV